MIKLEKPSKLGMFLEFLGCIVIAMCGTMLCVLCIEPLWKWFITPVLGLAVPKYWVLVGFFITVSLFVSRIKKSDLVPSDDAVMVVFQLAVMRVHIALTTLGVGWLIHQVA